MCSQAKQRDRPLIAMMTKPPRTYCTRSTLTETTHTDPDPDWVDFKPLPGGECLDYWHGTPSSPRTDGTVTIPADTPPGKYTVQWLWDFAEFHYASCADIDVAASTGDESEKTPSSSAPQLTPTPSPTSRKVLLLNSNTACASAWSDMRVCLEDDADCTVLASSLLYVDAAAGEKGCGLGGFGCPGRVLQSMALANSGAPTVECELLRSIQCGTGLDCAIGEALLVSTNEE